METFLITVSTFVVTDLATGASSTTTSSTGASSTTTSSLTSSTGASSTTGADAAIASPPAHDCKTSSTVFPDASALASADLCTRVSGAPSIYATLANNSPTYITATFLRINFG